MQKEKIKEVQEEDKSTKMLRLQQEMMLLQQEMDKESKEQLNDSSKTNNSDVLYIVTGKQMPTVNFNSP